MRWWGSKRHRKSPLPCQTLRGPPVHLAVLAGRNWTKPCRAHLLSPWTRMRPRIPPPEWKVSFILSSSRAPMAQEKPGIWMIIFPDRENRRFVVFTREFSSDMKKIWSLKRIYQDCGVMYLYYPVNFVVNFVLVNWEMEWDCIDCG